MVELGGPPLLGPGERLEQEQRRLEPVSRRGLLLEIGSRDRRIELDDRLPFLDGVALRDQQFVNVPLDRGRECRDVVGQGLAPPQSIDRLGQRPQPGRLGLHHDVGLMLLFVFFILRGRAAMRATAGEAPPQEEWPRATTAIGRPEISCDCPYVNRSDRLIAIALKRRVEAGKMHGFGTSSDPPHTGLSLPAKRKSPS